MMNRRLTVLTVLAVIFVVSGGIILTIWMVGETGRRMRRTLLTETRLAALSIEPGRLAGLTASLADLEHPDYLHLKQRLAEVVRLAETHRFSYLTGRRADGTIFFYVDNEPDNSVDCSPPGQVYGEATEGLHRAFLEGRETIEGPFPDRWGTWVSGFVPIRNADGAVVAVLGLDTDAGHWRWEIISRSALPVALMCCLLLVIVLRLLAIRSRAALRESEERHRIMFTDSPDACLILVDGVVSDCNRATEAMFGIPRAQFVGMRPADFSPPCQPDGSPSDRASKARIAETLTGGAHTFEWTHCRSDGVVFPAEISLSPMVLQGRPVLFTAMRDISERKRMEAALQLQLEEKETLLRETHHRIMNNLATVSGFLYLQAQSASAPEAAEGLHAAIRRVNGMGKLYEKMLVAREYREIAARAYLGELVDSVVELFSGQVAVTLRKEIDDFSIVSKTMFSLGIIVNELLTNALKYAFTDRAAGVIRIVARREDGRVRVTLEDDGKGLPEGFDADAKSGFGLSLVRMLCRQIDATLSFESDGGTRVHVAFDG